MAMQAPPDSTENPRGFGGTPDPAPETDAEGNELASEDEQMDYDLLTIRARKMMFGQGKEKILKMLGTSETPAQGIGKVGSMLIKSLMESSKQAGREISGDVAINAAAEIANDLNDLGIANKVFQYDSPEDKEKELADAMLWGVKYYGDGMISNNEISPDMQKIAKQEVEEGLKSEGKSVPQQTPIAAGVSQAVNPAGVVGAAMQQPGGQ